MNIIHTYTRAQAISDGVLIDVSDRAREYGINWPVAFTSAAHARVVAWDDATENGKPYATGQDEDGRLWDVLTMARLALRPAVAAAQRDGYARHPFQVLAVPATGRSIRPHRHDLILGLSVDETGSPVVTIMLPDED